MPDVTEQLRQYGEAAARHAAASDEERTGVTPVEIRPRRHERTGRRRWLVAAAAVAAAVLLFAGTVLVTGSNDDRIRARVPAGPTPIPTTVAPSPWLNALPPEGATPSTPETGEVVAGIAFSYLFAPSGWVDSSINVYADGRVILLASHVPGGMAEQRLSADGVERVRSAFLSTGLFDPGQSAADIWYSCTCMIRVRDDSGRMVLPAPMEPSALTAQEERAKVDPQVMGEVDRLVEFMTHLDSSLPASAWADREISPFVPSRYLFCVWYLPWQAPENLRDGGSDRAVPDLSNALAQHLPTPLVQFLDDQGWQHTPWNDCVAVGLADAQALAEALPAGGLVNAERGSLTYRSNFNIRLTPLQPDGPPWMAPG